MALRSVFPCRRRRRHPASRHFEPQKSVLAPNDLIASWISQPHDQIDVVESKYAPPPRRRGCSTAA